jgi:uncharacterized membrane protein (UPF0127 family)
VLQDIPIEVELAITQEARSKGLSGRKSLPEGTGMLFVFEQAQICQFWMKDTLVPLSIGFFDEKKRLLEWRNMPPPGEKKLTFVTSQKPSKYALEMPLDWFARNDIQAGAQLMGNFSDEK